MDGLLRRFLLFGIGLLMGSFLVTVIFEERISSCSYFPNERVIDESNNRPWRYSKDFENQLKINKVDSLSLRKIFMVGEIDFKKSEPRKKPCGFYIIHLKDGLKSYTLQFDKCPNHLLLVDLKAIAD